MTRRSGPMYPSSKRPIDVPCGLASHQQKQDRSHNIFFPCKQVLDSDVVSNRIKNAAARGGEEGQRMVFLEMHFPHTTPPSLHLVSAIHRSLFFTSTGYRGQRYFMMASNRLHRASSHTTVSIRSFHRYLSFAIYCIIVFQPTFSQAWEKRQTSHGKSVIAYYAR